MALHEPITETLKHIHFISHHLSSPLLRLMRAREKWRGAGRGLEDYRQPQRCETRRTWDYLLAGLLPHGQLR